MKPYLHAKASVKKFQGRVSDYLPIHDFIDSSKSAHATMKHRAVFHNAFGIYIVERVFGTTITNSDGKVVSVRDIAENHVKEDMGGRIPSLDEWLKEMPIKEWMGGRPKKIRRVTIVDDEENVD